MHKIKKYIFPTVALLVSLYVSLLFALGMIVGYISTHYGHKRITRIAKLQSININLTKKWRFHVHHWLLGTSAAFIFWWSGFLQIWPMIFLGMIGGFIAHDLHQDKDWYRIFLRR